MASGAPNLTGYENKGFALISEEIASRGGNTAVPEVTGMLPEVTQLLPRSNKTERKIY